MGALDRIRRAIRKVDEAQPDTVILCGRRYELAPEEAEVIRNFDAWLREKAGPDPWLREQIMKEREARYGDGGTIT